MIYRCQKCGKEAKVVRFDLDSDDKRQVCDKCYWNKDENIRNKTIREKR